MLLLLYDVSFSQSVDVVEVDDMFLMVSVSHTFKVMFNAVKHFNFF